MSISDAFTNNDYLFIGEIGDENVLVRESILSLQFDLAATMVSEIQFEVYDPGFKMLNSNFFMIGRRVAFVLPETITLQESDGEDVTVSIQTVEFEIAAIAASHGTSDTVTVTARSRPMQQMRREKGQRSYGRISPTAFASAAAARFGLKFFGESTPVDGNIIREQHEQKDESTFDVLSRLAREAEFMFFEANGIMYFASEEFIIARQPSMEINVPSANTDPFFASSLTVRRSTDSRNSAATLQASLIKNTSSITVFPGVGVTIKGLDNFDKKFMVDRVSFDTTKTGFVAISGTCPEDSDDMGCDQKVFAIGSTGKCVERIQKAIASSYSKRQVTVKLTPAEIAQLQKAGINLINTSYVTTINYALPIDGRFGQVTEDAVKNFQKLNNLPVDGIVDEDDWAIIKAAI